MRILGVDPGSRATGYGLVEAGRVLAFGVITPREKNLERRLLKIYQSLEDLIYRFSPTALALEEVIPESFPRSALKLGQAQGVALLAAAKARLPVYLYHPVEVKKAFTGYGKASKEQLRFVISRLLALNEELPLDASDALSVALYHLQVEGFRAKLG